MSEISGEGYDPALQAYRNGDYTGSVEIFRQYEKDFGKDFWFKHDEAVALTATCQIGNVRKAINLLEQCRTEDPKQSWCASSLAIAYGRAGMFPECLKAYQDALDNDPSNPEATLIRIEDAEDTTELHNRIEVLQRQGKVEFTQNKNPVAALRFYEAALALGGEHKAPWAIFDRAAIFEHLELYPEATLEFQQAKRLLPQSAWPDIGLGKMYEATGRITEARAVYRESLQKSPANEEAQVRLSNIGNVNDIGLLEWEEFAKRRSKTLINDPHASLDEHQEIDHYISRLPTQYRNELLEMDTRINRPMEESCRVAVVIPAYKEGGSIFRTLSQFTNQLNRSGEIINPSAFEIIIVDNHPENVANDNTADEVTRFQQENPNMRVLYTHKEWRNGEGGVGNARKYGSDLALIRSSNRPEQTGDLVIFSSDADLYGVSNIYVSEIIKAFDDDSMLDALAGEWTLPDEYLANPNLRASYRLAYLIERVIQKNFIPGREKGQPNFPKLHGVNSAFRASIYAAVGGFNKYARLAEDLEVGWMIRAARDYRQTQKHIEKPMRVVTDPRRFLAALSQGVPFMNMYEGFHENSEIRQLDNLELLDRIPQDFDAEILERNADAIWQAQEGGPYKWYPNFPDLFNRTLKLMGVRYVVEDRQDPDGVTRSHIRITDTTRLEKRLESPISSRPANQTYAQQIATPRGLQPNVDSQLDWSGGLSRKKFMIGAAAGIATATAFMTGGLALLKSRPKSDGVKKQEDLVRQVQTAIAKQSETPSATPTAVEGMMTPFEKRNRLDDK